MVGRLACVPTSQALPQRERGAGDDIPLFEVAQTAFVRDQAPTRKLPRELAGVLVKLFCERRIAVTWGLGSRTTPARVYGSKAVELLGDLRRYQFVTEEALGLARTYYVNVDNIAE